ncbi:MAG TPA: alpha/beta fold hydrolase [Balneolaceae bacterium]|nr:alpha/beta fold hydrolase [Balneolaceae bacterium]
MQEVLISGKTSFKIEVPYKLIDTGDKQPKPLVVYLHGFNQNIIQFQKLVEPLTALNAYHLFIQGPYPIYNRRHTKKVKDWGRAWYLYDGEQDQFIKSLELASEFIQEVIDGILEHISVNRITVFGYSMGGYLSGYFALSRWKHVNELIVIGGRIKTEIFEERKGVYKHLNVLALHGSGDKKVKSNPQEKSCEQLAQWGANVTFKELDGNHSLSSLFVNETLNWLYKQGYS